MDARKGIVWVIAGASAAAFLCMMALGGAVSGQPVEEPPPFLRNEQPAPATANVPCEPTEEHPYPVVLVHGTFEDAKQNWEALSLRLTQEKGYCVFALNYGEPRGMGPIQGSARELRVFVDRVLEYTRAEKVQIVGHSQGGMMPRYWMKFYGGASKVEDLVGIAPSNYGTRLSNASDRDADPRDFGIEEPNTDEPCYACEQQAANSAFIERLNRGDDTRGPGSFTVIATRPDEIIDPDKNTFLRGTERTINLVIQDYNGGAPVTHQNIYQDAFVQALVFDALDNEGTADPDRTQFPTETP